MRVSSSFHRALSIIIGGTNISVGVITSDGDIEAELRLNTQSKDGIESAMSRITDTIEHLCASIDLFPSALAGIGIGCTGVIDSHAGTILTAFSLPRWENYSLTHHFHRIFNLPTIIVNNVDAAIVGEAFVHRSEDYQNMILLSLGTGVGGAVLVDGNVYRGPNGEHPELGHILVRGTGSRCRCGQVGCLEMVSSGTAISTAGKRVGLNSTAEVFVEAKNGNPAATKIVRTAVECTARGIWTLAHTFMPSMIILGGGIIEEHYELFRMAIVTKMSMSSIIHGESIALSKAIPGNQAGMIGVAMLVFKMYL